VRDPLRVVSVPFDFATTPDMFTAADYNEPFRAPRAAATNQGLSIFSIMETICASDTG
jgi:hypothetical protein